MIIGDNLSDEEYRHQCEVRYILQWRAFDRSQAIKYLSDVRKRRGDDAADRLVNDCKEQWERGNRGEKGDWRG